MNPLFRIQSNRLGSAKTQRLPYAQNVVLEINDDRRQIGLGDREVRVNKINIPAPLAKPVRAFSSKPQGRNETELKTNNFALPLEQARPLSKKSTGSFSNLPKSTLNLENYTIGPVLGNKEF